MRGVRNRFVLRIGDAAALPRPTTCLLTTICAGNAAGVPDAPRRKLTPFRLARTRRIDALTRNPRFIALRRSSWRRREPRSLIASMAMMRVPTMPMASRLVPSTWKSGQLRSRASTSPRKRAALARIYSTPAAVGALVGGWRALGLVGCSAVALHCMRNLSASLVDDPHGFALAPWHAANSQHLDADAETRRLL